MSLTRRHFCSTTALALLAPGKLRAQAPSARADVAAIDRDRILAAANRFLTQPPATITGFPASQSPGTPQDFYSEAAESTPDAKTGATAQPFTAHSEALLNFSIQVPALTAAFVLTNDLRYATHAAAHLRAWFVDPAHRMAPQLPYAQLIRGSKEPRFEGILETVHLAEVAQAVSFLTRTEALPEADLTAIYAWFAAYLEWLGSARVALLARDQRSHHGTSWLLQAAAYARLVPLPNAGVRKIPQPTSSLAPLTPPPNEIIGLIQLRHFFRTTTLRAQMVANGSFPREVTSSLPYRNSLFNLDMLAAICDLLSTRFESAWEYELQDGPGMRVAIAHHFPYILNRGAWPYRADTTLFTALPLRQPSLLLAGRAYSRPEYVDLWKSLPSDPTNPILQLTFPIRQPLLWVRRAPAM
ncbi:MAG: hypothetical protein JWM43_3316 [Acidobacteriaceae bacterium]|nr:hypothetical protein [Acidobacteriaceae bacterium]